MKTVTLEMPLITKCMAIACAYNVNSNCNARAITVGDATHPSCDTFIVSGASHTKAARQSAGIGACKTATCKFNTDLECTADTINVGLLKSEANCLTFTMR